MAGLSLSKSKLFFSLPGLSINRIRGYATAQSAGAGFGRGGHMNGMVGMSEHGDRRAVIRGSEASCAWAPDPLTGYYRPANRPDEIDPAELRKMLLNHKVKPF